MCHLKSTDFYAVKRAHVEEGYHINICPKNSMEVSNLKF